MALEATCLQAVIALVTKDLFCPMIRAHVRAARGLALSFKGRIRNNRSAEWADFEFEQIWELEGNLTGNRFLFN